MGKVLITDSVHPLLIKGLENVGFECDYQPDISLNEVRKIIGAYHGLIINSKILADRSMLDDSKQLRFIGRLGSGMEIIDTSYAASKKIAVFGAPEGNRNAVAEHALGMLLTLSNQLLRADKQLRQMIWNREQNRGFELAGKTVGIIGFGHTGSSFAAKLAGLDVSVLAYDKYKKSGYARQLNYVTETELNNIQENADIISLHLPLSAETKYMINAAFLTKCKKNLILINTSRGNIVHTEHLLDALRAGLLGGTCLDVFENEKPATFSKQEQSLYTELYAFDNVVLSPHVAGWTVESKERIAQVLLDKIRAFCEAGKKVPDSNRTKLET